MKGLIIRATVSGGKYWPALLGLCLCLAAVSCERRQAKGPVAEVRLGYFANLTHAQAVLGVASGDFARAIAPARLRTQVFNAGPSLIEALLAGEIDVAYVGPGPVLNAQAKTHGQGVRVIAAGASNGVVIVARAGSGIKTLADLKGKRLATPQHGNTQDLAARHFVRFVLHQDNDDNVLPIANAEQAAMMGRRQIDAAWAPEPWGALMVSQDGAHVIAQEKDLWPGKEFTLTVVITTPEFLADHPDVVKKMLRVHRTWTRRLEQEPDQCLPKLDEALFGLTGKRMPSAVMAEAIKRVKFTDQPLKQTFATLADWSYELEFTVQPPNLSGLFDTSILDKLSAKSEPHSARFMTGEVRQDSAAGALPAVGANSDVSEKSPVGAPAALGAGR